MNPIAEKRLLYKISRDYYFNQLTQNDIAKRLGLSRIKVSRLLKQARQENIVSITLNSPPGLLADLEEAIEKKYQLEEVRVVQCEETSTQASVVPQLAPAASETLLRRIEGAEVIGVAMGQTMTSVVNSLPQHSLPGIKIVQMNGGLGHVVSIQQSAELARQMSVKLGGELRLLHAPGFAADQKSASVFKSDPMIAETLALAARANIAILSIGRLSAGTSQLLEDTLLSKEDLAVLHSKNAVGDIALRYINESGQHIKSSLDQRIIGLSFEELQHIPCVIAVAGGDDKFEAIRAGLLSGIPNVLITDNVTAERLVE
jgi:DNA-binding transcriptional regulator LsrR (DeoR family)